MSKLVQTLFRCTGKQSCLSRRKFAKAVGDDKDMKQVSYDYCFTRDQPGMESAKILVSKDRATRRVSAHVMPLKGAVIDWVIQQCARDLERLGHSGQITLKSDQEPAIMDVLKEIANLCGSRGILFEHSPVADSQSNGLWRAESGQLRR